MTTMKDVAERARVSSKTVSRVLRNDRYVTDGVRERVMEAVRELNYLPNMLAVTFRSGREGAIGVAVPDIADPFFASIIKVVEIEARLHQTAVIVTSLGYEPDHEQDAVETLLRRQITGLISCPVSADQSYLRPWQDRTAMVFIDRSPKRLTADSVVEDDLGGARAAVEHLLGHGHSRIAFVGDTERLSTTLLRLQGYRAALEDAGQEPDESLIYLGPTATASVDTALGALADLDPPPTAVFSSNARCTLDLIPAMQRMALTDTSIVSFGDFPMAQSLRPAITVIDQSPNEVGRLAAERLFLRVAQPNRRLRRRTLLPVSLVERDSCQLFTDGTLGARPGLATTLRRARHRSA